MGSFASMLVEDRTEEQFKDYVIQLLQMPLRIMVWTKQSKVGLWVRNGLEVEGPISYALNHPKSEN